MALSESNNRTISLEEESGITNVTVTIIDKQENCGMTKLGDSNNTSNESCNNNDPGQEIDDNGLTDKADQCSTLDHGEFKEPLDDLSVNQWIESIEKQVNDLKETTEAITKLLVDDLETIKTERNKLSEEIEEIFHNINSKFGRRIEKPSEEKKVINSPIDSYNNELTPDELQANAPETETDYEKIYEIIKKVLQKKRNKQLEIEENNERRVENSIPIGINVLTKSKSIPLAVDKLKNAEVFNKEDAYQGDTVSHHENITQNADIVECLEEEIKPMCPSASEGVNEGSLISPILTNNLNGNKLSEK